MIADEYVFDEHPKPQEIEDFLESHPQNNLLQHARWSQVKENWLMKQVVVRRGGTIRAYAMILIRPLPLGLSLFYIPRGPIANYQDEPLIRFLFAKLKKLARRSHAVTLRFDPNLIDRAYPYAQCNQTHDEHHQAAVVQLLTGLKCRHKGYTLYLREATQPRFQAVMLREQMDWAALNAKTRRSIRHAEKCGVTIHEGETELDPFVEVMKQTEQRKKIHLRNAEYFKRLMTLYGERAVLMTARLDLNQRRDQIENLISGLERKPEELNKAEKEQIINLNREQEFLEKKLSQGLSVVTLCGLLALIQDDQMEVLYAGTNSEFLTYRAPYSAHWKLFEKARKMGIQRCNLGGVEGTLDDGLSIFKGNFPIQIEEMIGEFDLPVMPVLAWMLDRGIALIKTVRRWRVKTC